MKTLLHVIIVIVLPILLIGPRLAMPAQVYAATADFLSSTSDGHVQGESTVSYATVHAFTNGTSLNNTGDSIFVGQNLSSWTVGGVTYYNYIIMRGFLFFDTSALPDNAIISSATLKLYGQYDQTPVDFNLTIVNGQPNRPTDPLQLSDFNINNYSGNGGTLGTFGWNTAGYNTINLSSEGLGWINKTGTTKLGLLSSRDISSTPPTYYEDVSFYSRNYAGGVFAPTLHVEYIAPPTAYDNSVGTGVNVPVAITLAGSDDETCDLTFSIVTPPLHGTLSSISNNSCAGSGPYTDSAAVTYTPAPGYTGPDLFTFKVNDGTLDSNVANVNITVNASPTLTASITSPANGTTYQPGQCFDVTAVVRLTCPVTIGDAGNSIKSLFIKPVYANSVQVGASSVKATISIVGNAATSEAATKDVAATLNCPPASGSEASVTWRVCCTGAGQVRVTVTPSGNYPCGTIINENIFDFMVKPVFAGAPPSATCTIPSSNLIPSTIVVQQIASPKPRPKPFQESSSSSGGTSNYGWAKPADTKVLTASVQPSQVIAGQPVKIMANVVNRGDQDGSLTAKLSINGQIEDSKQLIISANSGKPIEFTVTKELPGIYQVDVNGQQAYFTVIAAKEGISARTIACTIIVSLAALAIFIGIALALSKRSTS